MGRLAGIIIQVTELFKQRRRYFDGSMFVAVDVISTKVDPRGESFAYLMDRSSMQFVAMRSGCVY